MEPMTSIVGSIFKLLKEIAKAVSTARRNRTRCRELARRAEDVGNVLRDSMARARGEAAPARKSILSRLKEALDDALKLVESCRRRGSVVSRLYMILTSGSKAARFDDVDKRITTCLVDLGTANGVSMESKIDQLAARDRPRTNKPKQKQMNAAPKGGKRRRRKKTAAAAAGPPPPLSHAGVPAYPNRHGYVTYAVHHHSIEEDPTSCSVM